MPAVSVIIPAWNAAAFIGVAVASVFAQTFQDRELIVVNDGSPDTRDLEAVLGAFRSRDDFVYVAQKNGGPGAARNSGIAAARGDYLAFLDADDWGEPGYLAVQMQHFADDPSLDLVYCDARLVGDSPLAGRTFMDVHPSTAPVTLERLVTLEANVPTTCTVVRREAVVQAGGFDAEIRWSEDFDLWFRLALRGTRMTFHRGVLANHRIHESSAVADRVGLFDSQLRVYRKCAALVGSAHSAAPLLNEQMRRAEADLALARGKRHLAAREYRQAAQSLRAASRYYSSAKLTCAWVGLYTVPGLVRRWYRGGAAPS